MKLKYILLFTTSLFLSLSSLATVHNVTVQNFTFSPAILNIEAGDTVIFTNVGGNHNVTADDGSFRCSTNCEVMPGDGNGAPDATNWVSSITFNSVGNFNYFCEVHGNSGGVGMSGVINVIAPVSTVVHTIQVFSNSFNPVDLTIEPGDIVNFVLSEGFHNVRADDDSFECSQGCLNTGKNLTSEPSASPWDVFVKFDDFGDVPYYCEAHGNVGGVGMSGIIRVDDTVFTNSFE
jgi:plastocyanin